MIEVNELRVGNYITIEDQYYSPYTSKENIKTGFANRVYSRGTSRIVEIRSDSVITNDGTYTLNYIYPITLTEERLLKCGFNNVGFYDNVFSCGDFRVHIGKENKKALLVYHHENNHIELEVGSLHDLQNKLFALVGKEFDLKL